MCGSEFGRRVAHPHRGFPSRRMHGLQQGDRYANRCALHANDLLLYSRYLQIAEERHAEFPFPSSQLLWVGLWLAEHETPVCTCMYGFLTDT